MFANIAKRVHPELYVGGGWNSSVTKVVAKAVVGYCKHHHLDDASLLKWAKEQHAAQADPNSK